MDRVAMDSSLSLVAVTLVQTSGEEGQCSGAAYRLSCLFHYFDFGSMIWSYRKDLIGFWPPCHPGCRRRDSFLVHSVFRKDTQICILKLGCTIILWTSILFCPPWYIKQWLPLTKGASMLNWVFNNEPLNKMAVVTTSFVILAICLRKSNCLVMILLQWNILQPNKQKCV